MPLSFADQIWTFVQQCGYFLKPWGIVLGILWAINILNWITGSRLSYYFALVPRTLSGLIGIPFSPIFHAGFTHLFFNSIPLFILGLALLGREGVVAFCWITTVITLLGGIGVWLVARTGRHIGASGVISGYFGYILMTAYKDTSVVSVLLAILAIYYFGGILLGLLPRDKQISWEAHLFGFLAGIACVYLPNEFLYFIQTPTY